MAWYAKFEGVDGSSSSADGKWFVADSFSFGVEREMKESGEKGGTEDLVVSKSLDMTTTPLFDDHTGGANFVLCDGSVRPLDGQDDPNLLLPAVSDPNLLLPAVTDPKLLLPYTDFDIA